MKVGEILTCEEFNNQAIIQWKKDCENKADNEPLPQLIFRVYTTQDGELMREGYVGKYKHGTIWRKTKQEVQEKLKKEMD